jgi:hypothetical protein
MHLSSPIDAPLRVKPLLVGEASRPGSGALGGLLGDTKLTRGLANPFGGSAFGAPVAPEPKDLPSIVDMGGTVFDPKSHTNRANLQSAVERRKVTWNALRHASPEDKPAAELAFKAAQQVEAERSRLPGVDLPVLPPRFDSAMASSKHDRGERNVDTGTISGTAGRIAKNTASDATAVPLSLLELGNNLIGWQHIPEGKSIEQHNAELGANIATSAVGGMADQGRGLLELSGSNTLLTNPITVFLTVVDPALKAAERVGMTAQVAKAREAMRPHVARGINTAIDKALGAERHERWGENLGEMKAAVQRTLVDGVIQRSPVATAIVEALVHGPERAAATVRNLFEIAARQVEQGKVALKPVDLEPVKLTYAPAMAREVAGLQHAPARKAERAAESALDAAEEAGNRPIVNAGTAYLPTGRHSGSLDARSLLAREREYSRLERPEARRRRSERAEAEGDRSGLRPCRPLVGRSRRPLRPGPRRDPGGCRPGVRPHRTAPQRRQPCRSSRCGTGTLGLQERCCGCGRVGGQERGSAGTHQAPAGAARRDPSADARSDGTPSCIDRPRHQERLRDGRDGTAPT